MRRMDIVVNLWTPDLTKNYTPKLNHFWKQIHILGRDRRRAFPSKTRSPRWMPPGSRRAS